MTKNRETLSLNKDKEAAKTDENKVDNGDQNQGDDNQDSQGQATPPVGGNQTPTDPAAVKPGRKPRGNDGEKAGPPSGAIQHATAMVFDLRKHALACAVEHCKNKNVKADAVVDAAKKFESFIVFGGATLNLGIAAAKPGAGAEGADEE